MICNAFHNLGILKIHELVATTLSEFLWHNLLLEDMVQLMVGYIFILLVAVYSEILSVKGYHVAQAHALKLLNNKINGITIL